MLTNIDADGAPSMGFHSDQSLLDFDPASGDHGLAFYGHSHITQSFLVRDADKGWLCYFCDLSSVGGGGDAVGATTGTLTRLALRPRDSYRRKIFVAPLGLQVVSDAGTLASAQIAVAPDGTVTGVSITYDTKGEQPLTRFRLRLLSRRGKKPVAGFSARGLSRTRGGYDVPLDSQGQATVTVDWS